MPRKPTAAPAIFKEKIVPIKIEDEMKASYIDYAMSVIVGRALPDVRDGLKPVHRRILYGMYEQGMIPGRSYKKSARVVGDVLGKYHPHGDVAVYDAMVRMAQSFAQRYRLIDGQGNFGSIDGDPAAAMRYTEARLSSLAMELLADLEKDTVDFVPNFDESLNEPTVLPAKLPNLLINGSSGIAVGMATNIPPHNLVEVADAIVTTIDNPDISIEDLIKIVPGPDFPTGGIICGRKGIKEAYTTGRGLINVRAEITLEEVRGDKQAIIVSEIPYQVNKSLLIERIAELVKEKKVVGIADLRDESDRKGLRIYIELKRDINPDIVLNQLYKHTPLQETFGVNILALVDGQPKILTLKDLIQNYIAYREDVIRRRTTFDLNQAKQRAHILEGLRICLENLDAIIKLIKSSKTPDEAKTGLMKSYKLTEVQAQAILDMRLQRLTALERAKLEEEYQQLLALIKELSDILAKPSRILKIIKSELAELKEKYGDKRRTKFARALEEVDVEDLIHEEEVTILLTQQGFIKRIPVKQFRAQQRGGRGISAMTVRETDLIDKVFVTSTHNFILLFTNRGRIFRLKAYEIPEASRQSKGQSVVNLLHLAQEEHITAMFPIKEFQKGFFLVMATEKGIIKKTSLDDFENLRRSGMIAIKLDPKDRLGWVHLTDGKQEIVIATSGGMSIRFSEKDVRAMGRAAQGVKAIKLKADQKVVSMDIIQKGLEVLAVTKKGFGKLVKIKEFRLQRRGGSGIKLIKLKTKLKDQVCRALLVSAEDEIILVTKNGTLNRQKISGISSQHRASQGVIVLRLEKDDEVCDVAQILTEVEDIEEKTANG